MYATLQQVASLIPSELILGALDDNRDGAVDEDVSLAMQTAVDSEIDSLLGQRYPVPFAAPLPSVVSNAAIVLRCEALYLRRGIPVEQNPFAARAKECRAKLDRIGRGLDPLRPDSVPMRSAGILISEPSRLTTILDGDGTEATQAPRILN